MATIKQIEANRKNAKRSTGPTTDAGKKIVSQNALRHGLLSRCIVLKAEAGDRFEDLIAALTQEFQPATANEQALVDTMAAARWRLMRNWTLQTAMLEIETARQDPEAGSPPVVAALAFKSLADNSSALHLLQRYETAYDRQYARALNLLLKARAARTGEPPPHPPTPALGLSLEGTWRSDPDNAELPNKGLPNKPISEDHGAEIAPAVGPKLRKETPQSTPRPLRYRDPAVKQRTIASLHRTQSPFALRRLRTRAA